MTRLTWRCLGWSLLLAAAASLPLAAGQEAVKEPSKESKSAAPEKQRPVGTWTRTAGTAKITFHIHKSSLRCTLEEGERQLTVEADYSVSKDGVLFGRVRQVEKKGFENAPEVGALFSFRFQQKGNILTISDLQPPAGDGQAQQVIEGDYQGQPAKSKRSTSKK